MVIMKDKQLITEKLFRVTENMKKIKYIKAHSDVTDEILLKAAVVSIRNPYHNFGHAIGATEQAMRLAIAEGRSRSEINLVAYTMLFHDGGHTGTPKKRDEPHAYSLAKSVLTPSDTIVIGKNHAKVMRRIKELLLSTIFPGNRGQTDDGLIKIIHDADLAHIGQGPVYWIWASMGLYDEFKLKEPGLTLEVFIRERQPSFVKYLTKLSGTGKAFVSDGAQKIFRDPTRDVLLVKNWPIEAIEYAHSICKDNVSLARFKREIGPYLKVA